MTWDIRTPLAGINTASGNWIYGVINGLFYASGINDNVSGITTQSYDVGADAWTTRTAHPQTGLRQMARGGAIHGDRLYHFGMFNGISPTNLAYYYDAGDNAWTQITNLPATRALAVAGTSGDFIYICGGSISSLTSFRYDVVGNSYITRANIPAVRRRGTGGVVSGVLYHIGGENSSGTVVDTVYAYDIAGNSWTTKTAMPVGVHSAGSAVRDGKIYVFGGVDGTGAARADVWSYDPVSDTWTEETALVLPVAGQGEKAVGLLTEWFVISRPSGVQDSAFFFIAAPPPPPPPASTATPDPTGARLGCGDFRVFLQRVGGSPVLAEVHHNRLLFSRRLDEMTSSRVELSADQDPECIAHLGSLDPFRHEISLWRDGEEVWVGPITEPVYSYDGLVLEGRDLFMWFERRFLPTDRAFASTDLSTIAATYASDALDQDASPNISLVINPTGVLGDRAVQAALFRRAADELRELARTGLDFTAIGRTIRFGGEEIGTPAIGTLTEDVFEVSDARLAGLDMANEVIVLGSSGSGINSPTAGRAGGVTVPLVQQVYSEPSILDATSALRAAETRLDLLREPPFFISGRLLEDAPIPFSRLIPGATLSFNQQVGFRRIAQQMRLLSVDVEAAASDQGVTEAVRLMLEPIGTVES